MTLRFLQTTPSASPDFPFQAGQVVKDLPRLSPEMRQWIRDGVAELIRDEEPIEAVVVPALEHAVSRKRKAR